LRRYAAVRPRAQDRPPRPAPRRPRLEGLSVALAGRVARRGVGAVAAAPDRARRARPAVAARPRGRGGDALAGGALPRGVAQLRPRDARRDRSGDARRTPARGARGAGARRGRGAPGVPAAPGVARGAAQRAAPRARRRRSGRRSAAAAPRRRAAPVTTDREPFARYRELLEGLGFRPSRRLGQNFLLEPALHRAVADAAEVRSGDLVLEPGAGLGFLTRELLARTAPVVAVEIDPRLLRVLRAELA